MCMTFWLSPYGLFLKAYFFCKYDFSYTLEALYLIIVPLSPQPTHIYFSSCTLYPWKSQQHQPTGKYSRHLLFLLTDV